ncbi:sensor histidine kinase [Pontibacter lucknowensis]|uniref:histidine kinase n=1 Tax=Pontibacter lucknowensis TaxID=1077936 RepID=A0A1N6XE94_9BACT|nr:PAS domain-containing sensor histidine kinase [Pontibacter lucknowensis]SIR00559.1 PAS domain S-box-containing protein [Pontibacter lucknowensis]
MKCVYYIGLHEDTLHLFQEELEDITLQAVREEDILGNKANLTACDTLLVGEQVLNPVRIAQESFSRDKAISILLINDKANHQKVKNSLQFAPFVGPTIQAVTNELGTGLVPIVEDAVQRTEQRRSYVRIRSASSSITAFTPNYMEKVRVNYMARVLDEAPIGAALLAKDGTVLNVNNYIVRLLGRTDREILGIAFADHFPVNERNALQDFISDGYHSKQKRIFELGKGDSRKFLEISIGDIDAESSSPYKIAIVNDVTEATQARQRTLAHVDELQKLNEELRVVNEDLDTFVYTASHDLKSPILNIEGLVNLLEESLSQQPGEVPELEHIRRSVERFKATIEDLTEVARIQRSFGQEASELSVADMVADVQQLLQPEIDKTGAVIEVDIKQAPHILFSRKNFKSILLNLMSNAIKYHAPQRQLHIKIRTAIEQDLFLLSVQDNGLGIPTGRQDRVFQLFKRMHMHVQGSGIGLYIVKRIVSNSGGTVTVTSKEGEGTTFTVSLPVQIKRP